MQNRRNWGLGVRMVIALLALGVLYIGLGYSIALLFGVFAGASGLGHTIGITIAVGLLAASQYYYGANIALRVMGARVVEREEYPELHDRVQKLSQQADVPKPRVAIADNRTPNAFATGRKRKDAVICVTTGLMTELDDEELDAVLAHELAHIVNRDFQLMTVVTALSAIAGWIVRWGFLFGDGGSDGAGQWQLLAGYFAAIIVWIGAFLVGRLLSRYREYAADRGAAMITGNPAALASALKTISGSMDNVPDEDLRQAEQVNALLASEVTKSRMASIFNTHPDVESRIERLQDMAVEMEQ